MSAVTGPIVIIGAGPAGTSAALALRERGAQVHVLDAGDAQIRLPPAGDFLNLRFQDSSQWRWQLGDVGESLAVDAAVSPKFRVPGLSPIFKGYQQANRLRPDESFHAMGALAAGGLSNAWGCGVARFNDGELGDLVADRKEMDISYDRVGRRMGLSGASPDALSAYLGLDEISAPALPMDSLHTLIWQRRSRSTNTLRLGRARVAVLSEPQDGREVCDLSGMCLWGCSRRSTWSAALTADHLKRDRGVRFEGGVCVEALAPDGVGGWWIHAQAIDGPRRYRASKVLLAAGTLATTRLALSALADRPKSVRLLSNPMAAFLLWLPERLGEPRERSIGLAQLSFSLVEDAAGQGFGNLFSTLGIPVNEFLKYLPVTRRAGLPLLHGLLSSCVVGNLFLPGNLSAHTVILDADGFLCIKGGGVPQLEKILYEAHRALKLAFRRMGSWLLPGSFMAGPSGADLHYVGTLPISANPSAYQCRLNGEMAGLPGVFVLDGAALPVLPSKPHTLTVMANADRIARSLSITC